MLMQLGYIAGVFDLLLSFKSYFIKYLWKIKLESKSRKEDVKVQ